MAFTMEGDIVDCAVPRWNVWGRPFIIVWGDDINDKKNKKIYYVMALNGYQTGRHWIFGGETMRAPPKLILARPIFFAMILTRSARNV